MHGSSLPLHAAGGKAPECRCAFRPRPARVQSADWLASGSWASKLLARQSDDVGIDLTRTVYFLILCWIPRFVSSTALLNGPPSEAARSITGSASAGRPWSAMV